jgi:hypothetical protein
MKTFTALAVLLFSFAPAMAQTTSPFNGKVLENGTIVAGGTAQKIFGGDYIGRGYELLNPNTTTSDVCWFAQDTTASIHGAGSAPIVAGGGYVTPRDYSTRNGYVSIVCPTTGDTYVAKRW